MELEDIELARRIELHEARVWAECIAAASTVEDNPLRAEVVYPGKTPIGTLAALNFGTFNRVIALGVEEPATVSDLDDIEDFYRVRGQTRFQVEITPATRPSSIRNDLARRGITPTGERVAKFWRNVEGTASEDPDFEMVELGSRDRDAIVNVSLGAWSLPKFFAPWFAATIGVKGFHHFGIFDDDALVSTAVMNVDDGLAWTGFGATLPRYQGRGYQTGRLGLLVKRAADYGCHIIHNEAATGSSASPSTSFKNLSRTGFQLIYEKELFGPVSST